MVKQILDLTDKNSKTYDSAYLEKFTWSEDPKGTSGLLYVKYQSGDSYVYYDVPEEVYNKLKHLSYEENQDNQTAGEYIRSRVVENNQYKQKDIDYDRFGNVLNE